MSKPRARYGLQFATTQANETGLTSPGGLIANTKQLIWSRISSAREAESPKSVGEYGRINRRANREESRRFARGRCAAKELLEQQHTRIAIDVGDLGVARRGRYEPPGRT